MLYLILALAVQDGDAAEGAKFFAARCANCHFAAEPEKVKRDAIWTSLIKTTT